jgi:hypothetical protein
MQLNLLRASVHPGLSELSRLRPEDFIVTYDSVFPFLPLFVSSCYTPSAHYELFSMQIQRIRQGLGIMCQFALWCVSRFIDHLVVHWPTSTSWLMLAGLSLIW